MKFSIYNSTIHLDDKHTLLFNSFSKKFIAIKNKIFNINNISISDLKANNLNFFNQLCEGGFIIENSMNEIATLREKVINADNNYKEYILHINPTLDCNFKCWYCYENHVHLSKMNQETLESTKKFMRKIITRREIESFELGFFGGEPLLYFSSIAEVLISHAADLCKSSGKNLNIHFTSNGALLNNRIIEYLAQYNCGFQITLDGGEKFHDQTRYFKNKRGSFDIIVKNIIELVNAKINVIVRINYTNTNIDSVESILEIFKEVPDLTKQYLKFDFQRVWQTKTSCYDLTEQKIANIRQKFRNQKFQVLANYIPHDAMDSCYGDKVNHVLINYNGDVYGCTARDFSTENRIGVLTGFGDIMYHKDILHKRNSAKLSKLICDSCRIAPLCGGGCKQKSLEALSYDGCSLGYTETDKDRIILEIFEHSFNLQ